MLKRRYSYCFYTLIVGIVTLINAPSAWLSPLIEEATQGTVSFHQSWGTIWQGSAQLRLRRSERETTVLPHPIQWTLNFDFFNQAQTNHTATLTLNLQSNALLNPSILTIGFSLKHLFNHFNNGQWGISELTLSSSEYQLPANTLNHLGAPFNTLKLTGNLRLYWDKIHIAFNEKHIPLLTLSTPFNLKLRVDHLRTVVSQDMVLGDYELILTPILASMPLQSTIQLITLNNKNNKNNNHLLLNGTGQVSLDGPINFVLKSKGTTPKADEQLNGLLNFLGRIEGDEHVLRLSQ